MLYYNTSILNYFIIFVCPQAYKKMFGLSGIWVKEILNGCQGVYLLASILSFPIHMTSSEFFSLSGPLFKMTGKSLRFKLCFT